MGQTRGSRRRLGERGLGSLVCGQRCQRGRGAATARYESTLTSLLVVVFERVVLFVSAHE